MTRCAFLRSILSLQPATFLFSMPYSIQLVINRLKLVFFFYILVIFTKLNTYLCESRDKLLVADQKSQYLKVTRWWEILKLCQCVTQGLYAPPALLSFYPCERTSISYKYRTASMAQHGLRHLPSGCQRIKLKMNRRPVSQDWARAGPDFNGLKGVETSNPPRKYATGSGCIRVFFGKLICLVL